MNPRDFIALAGTLAASSAPHAAARYRTAVSRAYYGAFHAAVEVLEASGATVRANHLGHREAINQLRSSKLGEPMRAAGLLDDLHKARIIADYRLANRTYESSPHVLLAVEDAHDAVAARDACLNEPIRSQLIAHFTDGAAGSGP